MVSSTGALTMWVFDTGGLFPDCPLFGRDLLFVVRLRLLFGVRRRRCRRTLRLLCSAFGEFFLLSPFRLSPLLFLTLHFLLALFERDAHRSPQKSGATPTSLRVLGLPARLARLASRFAVILVRESATAATTTGACAAATAARGSLTLGPRFVDLEIAAAHFFSVESGNGFRCLGVIRHFHKSKAASTACLAICGDVNAPDLPKRLEECRQIGLSGLKAHVANKKTLHSRSPLQRT